MACSLVANQDFQKETSALDTEKMVLNHGEFDSISFENLAPHELKNIQNHVELTRHLQEIHSIYLMFQFNLDSFLNCYTLMNSGQVFRGGKPALLESDYISINAYVNNIISSGRTLTESMECYMKEHYSEGADARADYLNHYHSVYDNSFAYRLLIRLRDYSQHGHLPVTLEGDQYCINLYNVLNKPHFNHNPTIKGQIADAVNKIISIYRDTPTLSLTLTLAEFTAQLLSIYEKFWFCIQASLTASDIQFRKIVENHPENINSSNDDEPGFFVFELTKGMAHAVYLGDDTDKMFQDNYKEAVAAHRKYAKSWKFLCEGIAIVNLTAAEDGEE